MYLFPSLKNQRSQQRRLQRNVERVLHVIERKIVVDVTSVRYALLMQYEICIKCNGFKGCALVQ